MTSDTRTTSTPGQGTTLPVMMRAVRILTANAADGIEIQEIPVPQPAPGEVLVRVCAAAITRDELEWVTDRLPATPSYEFSGVVAAVGATVSDWTVGEDVFALSSFDRDGAAAEYIVVEGDKLASKPHSLGYVEAAAVPLAALSSWQGLFDNGHLVRGERVMIHGAGGGVGSFAVQLAHAHGAHVIATTGPTWSKSPRGILTQ